MKISPHPKIEPRLTLMSGVDLELIGIFMEILVFFTVGIDYTNITPLIILTNYMLKYA
jgi:hypothetical protein